MFTYWPFISLIVAGVMVTILLVLKFSEKLCGARLSSERRQNGGGAGGGSQHQVSLDLELCPHSQSWPWTGGLLDISSQFNARLLHFSIKLRRNY